MSVSQLKRNQGWKINNIGPTGVDPDDLGRVQTGITLIFEEGLTPGQGTVKVSSQWNGASWQAVSGTKVIGTLRNNQTFEISFPAADRLSCKVFSAFAPGRRPRRSAPPEAGSWTALEGSGTPIRPPQGESE